MKIIEHRRHSMRKIPGGVHLIQPGVDLARKVGNTMDTFNYVITSPKERAFETAIAMGYAVNETNEELASYGDDVSSELEYETLTWDLIKELLSKESHTLRFAKKQVALIYELVEKIKDGEKLLIISHGGMIEIPLAYLFKHDDYNKWGNLMSYCEGFRLTIDQNKVLAYDILRVN